MTEQLTPGSPADPAEPATAPKKGGAGKVLISILSVVALAVVVIGVKFGFREAFAYITGDTTKAQVGDCINNAADPNDMKLVDCAKPEAAFKIVGIVDDKTQTEAEVACESFATAESFLFQWEGTLKADTKGQVLCLEESAK